MKDPVVLVGETLVSLASPDVRPLDRGSSLDLTFAGAEVNVAIGLARLGDSARWVSAVGDDLFGRMVLRGLRGEGVDVSAVQVHPTAPTALMVKSPRPGAEPEVIYYRKGSAISLADPSTFPPEAFADAGALYLTGITPALSPTCRELVDQLIDFASERTIPVWFDPNHRRKLWSEEEARQTILPWLPKLHVILAGTDEGQILTGKTNPEEMGQALQDLGAPRVIVKDGKNGAWFFGEGEILHLPVFPIAAMVDPVGAGDAFGAGVLAARRADKDWLTALRWGHALGAMTCQTRGDWEGLPTPRQLDDFLAYRHGAVR